MLCVCVESDLLSLPAAVAVKPMTTTTDISGDEQLVSSNKELQQVRDKLNELEATMDQLRSDCERRVKQLESELSAERSARQQLLTEVEQLKKVVKTKLRTV